jgi:proton-translocating NADH-quinone oxidoreductase chain M
MIGIYGKRIQKIGAAYKLFFYTLLGSSFMFISLVFLLVIGGDLNYFTVNKTLLLLTESIRRLIWLSFFLAFLVKLPVMPFHLWLPEAHVEAPTTGSVLLAGVLLKMGGYGIFRFLLPLFDITNLYFIPMVYTFGIISVIYASIVTIRQVDIKKIIAYSSVAHMGISLFGIFSGTLQGLQGSYFLMLSHGIVASGLFASVGIIYDRYHTRLLNYYGGLVQFMPILAVIFFLLILGNVSFPFTSSFIAEFLIFVGCFQSNSLITFLALSSTLFGVIYSFWLYVRIFFGPVSIYLVSYSDVNDRELFYLSIFVIMMLTLGIYPNFILHVLYIPSILLI